MLVNYIVTNCNQPTNKERKMTSFTTVYHQEKFIHFKETTTFHIVLWKYKKEWTENYCRNTEFNDLQVGTQPNDKRTVITCYLYRNLVVFV